MDALLYKGEKPQFMDAFTLIFEGKQGDAIALSLEKLGWALVERRASNRFSADGTLNWKFLKNGKWPLTVEQGSEMTWLTLSKDDTVFEGIDEAFSAMLKKMAKEILPSGAEFRGNVAYWSKRGGYAGSKALAEVQRRAMALGFKKGEYEPFGNADGSTMGGGSTFIKGPWILSTSSSYGGMASDNRYSASLSFDAQRGR
jgi:hypothetical protein